MAADRFLQSLAESAESTRPSAAFIGGASRSGTTLLGSMLGAASDAIAVPEARFKWTLMSSCPVRDGSLDLSCAVRKLRQDWKFELWGIELPPPAGLPRGPVPYSVLLRSLAREYSRRHGKDAAAVWVDHTPGNLKYMSRLSGLLPDSRFVHLVRDGRAVAASLLPLDWGPNDVFEAAELWSLKVGMGIAASAALGERAMTVHYEDLVYEPERTLKELCDFLGLSYDDEMVGRRDFDLPTYTARQHELVSSAPDPSRVDSWRRDLTAEQVEAFEYLTGDMLAYLGYELETGDQARKPSRASHASAILKSAVRKRVSNPVRRYVRRKSFNSR